MPLSFPEFVKVLRGLPEGASREQVHAAADAAERGTPLEHLWAAAQRPLAGSADALIPQLRHEHGKDESALRKGAEDFGATLTSPASLATAASGYGAAKAVEAGLLGISRLARGAEAALQVPYAAEGVRNVFGAPTAGGKLAGAAEAAMAGASIKHAATHAFDPAAVAETYMKERGLGTPSVPQPKANPARGMALADAYGAMEHQPDHPAVKASYDALRKAIEDQWEFLTQRAGVKAEPWTREGQPYKNSAEMVADVKGNNHLFYFPSEAGFGQAAGEAPAHPMMAMTKYGVPANDLFRAVHDYFGHAQHGFQFGPVGEEGAWLEHRQMLPEEARPALTSETRGQNSWVNFGPHMRDESGALLAKDDPRRPGPAERPFAAQKAGLLPEALQQPDALATPRSGATAASETGAHASPSVSPELLADVISRHAAGGSSTSLALKRGMTLQDARFMLSPYEDRQVKLDHPPTEADLRAYIQQNHDLLSQPGHLLGTWKNPNETADAAGALRPHYLDVSIGENDPVKALQLAQQHKQLAFYDMALGKDIPTASAQAEHENILANSHYGEGHVLQNEMLPTELRDRAGLIDEPVTPKGSGPWHDPLVRTPIESLDQLAKAGSTDAAVAAARMRRANPDVYVPRGASTAMAIAAPAASAAIDDSDPNDPNYRLKHYGKLALDLAGLGGAAHAVMTAGMFPADLKPRLDEIRTSMTQAFKNAGQTVRESPIKTAIRKAILEHTGGDAKQTQFLEGLYHTIPLPTYDGINFDERRPMKELLAKGRTNTPVFKKFTLDRLNKAYDVGNAAGAHWGDPSWIAQMTGNDPELGVKFARALGATSPGEKTDRNAVVGAQIFIRHVLNGEPLPGVLKDIKLKNVSSKEPNLQRMSIGGRLFGDKVENLSGNELGIKGRIPIDMWLLRAMGSHTDKTPGPAGYRAMEDAFLNYAHARGEDPFSTMAKIWTGMQHIAGKPTPSWRAAFEKMGITGDLTDKAYRQWALDNIPALSKKLNSTKSLSKKALSQLNDTFAQVPPPPHTHTSVTPDFASRVNQMMLHQQYAGDALGRATVNNIDRARLYKMMAQQGLTEGLESPLKAAIRKGR